MYFPFIHNMRTLYKKIHLLVFLQRNPRQQIIFLIICVALKARGNCFIHAWALACHSKWIAMKCTALWPSPGGRGETHQGEWLEQCWLRSHNLIYFICTGSVWAAFYITQWNVHINHAVKLQGNVHYNAHKHAHEWVHALVWWDPLNECGWEFSDGSVTLNAIPVLLKKKILTGWTIDFKGIFANCLQILKLISEWEAQTSLYTPDAVSVL